ncbi:hypothetical protein QL285_059166 [Trifolium repens]|nr:hypothetical protein QL285_059166 [Trifolium repens]
MPDFPSLSSPQQRQLYAQIYLLSGSNFGSSSNLLFTAVAAAHRRLVLVAIASTSTGLPPYCPRVHQYSPYCPRVHQYSPQLCLSLA